jgi:hypothetical protein
MDAVAKLANSNSKEGEATPINLSQLEGAFLLWGFVGIGSILGLVMEVRSQFESIIGV